MLTLILIIPYLDHVKDALVHARVRDHAHDHQEKKDLVQEAGQLKKYF